MCRQCQVAGLLYSSAVLTLLLFSSNSLQFNTDIDFDAINCTYDGNFPEEFAPWTVLIRPLPHQTLVGALINNRTILATGETFLSSTKFKILPFANYTIQIGAHSSDHKEFVQIGNISYIKPHPKGPVNNKFWPEYDHNWVLIYLKEPIKFIKGIGPVCLPPVSLINSLISSKPKFVSTLSDVLIHGTINLQAAHETSYYVKLKSYNDCHNLWKGDPITTRYTYKNRVCGFVSQPNKKKQCIVRDSASVLRENNKWLSIGFQSFRRAREARKVCNESYLVYMSLLMPADLEWIHNDVKCGPLKFSCDNGTRCLELKTVCDGKSHSCEDGSDQNTNYCSALSKCESNQFTCSRGLAAYCIPSINPVTGKVAKNCNHVKDCPNGEDEEDELCASKTPMIWIYIGIGVAALFTSSVIIAVGCSRRRNLRDLTEEELIDFFEGERHLQTQAEEQNDAAEHYVEIRVDASGQAQSNPTYENEVLLGINDENYENTALNQPLLESDIDFCPENIRRLGYDPLLGFDVRIPSQCTLGPQIGKGTFGIIKKGFVNGKPAAIKFPNVSIEVNAFKVLLLELKIIKYVHDAAGDTGHPNIVRFVGADTTRIRQRILYVALEFCENGNIQEYIGYNRAHFETDMNQPPLVAVGPSQTTCRGNYDFKMTQGTRLYSECLRRLINWAAQIASGMKFLTHKVVHLDLAARNVLLDSNLVAKVGDFGLSRKVYHNITYKIERNDPLPFRWLAIEVLTTNKCSHFSDIWSYGVTLWELFSLCDCPWETVTSSHDLTSKLLKGERLPPPKYASKEVYNQMHACWNENPRARASFEDLKAFFLNLLQTQT